MPTRLFHFGVEALLDGEESLSCWFFLPPPHTESETKPAKRPMWSMLGMEALLEELP